jgi:hypothetical protein
MIECCCCRRDVSLVRRVRLRAQPICVPAGTLSVGELTDWADRNECPYRTGFICPGCYHALDTAEGVGEIGGQVFGLARQSRGDVASVYDELKFQEYLWREVGP